MRIESDGRCLQHDPDWPARIALTTQARVDVEVGELLDVFRPVGVHAAAVEYSEMPGDEAGVLRAEPEGDKRSGIAEHGLPQALRELPQILMAEGQRERIFSRLGEDEAKTVRRERLEFVGVEVEDAPVGLGRIRAGEAACARPVTMSAPSKGAADHRVHNIL